LNLEIKFLFFPRRLKTFKITSFLNFEISLFGEISPVKKTAGTQTYLLHSSLEVHSSVAPFAKTIFPDILSFLHPM
jgi:hypothetical protein